MSLRARPDRRLSLFSLFVVTSVCVCVLVKEWFGAINRAKMICREEVDARSA